MSFKMKIDNVVTGRQKMAYVSVKSVNIDRAIDRKTKKEYWDVNITVAAYADKGKKKPLPFAHACHRMRSLTGINTNPIKWAYSHLKTLPAFAKASDV